MVKHSSFTGMMKKMPLKKNIFLIGPMGAGKTSIGKLLAKALRFEFLDSDEVIEIQAGADIPWIFDIEGEGGFRAREKKVIDELTQRSRIVLATGGGAVLCPQNRINLSTRGVVIYLQVSVEEQLRRTYRNRKRPLILSQNPQKIFETLKLEREALYLQIAEQTIDTAHGSIKAIVNGILSTWQ